MELFGTLERILCMEDWRAGQIERAIYLIRGQRVMLDGDLAALYAVSTKRLNEQVRRNSKRFPADFMFRLSTNEATAMRSRFATASRRNRRYRAFVFTEHGSIMLASVLNTSTAIKASVHIVRAFVRFREWLAARKGRAGKYREFERQLAEQGGQIKTLFGAIEELRDPPGEPRRKIGFEPPA